MACNPRAIVDPEVLPVETTALEELLRLKPNEYKSTRRNSNNILSD